MAKIVPLRAPEPEKPKSAFQPNATYINSAPETAKKHLLQYISDEEGNNWRCICGFIYPRPPIEILLSDKMSGWLETQREEHEKT